jgi:carboxymethylenebutenolidase
MKFASSALALLALSGLGAIAQAAAPPVATRSQAAGPAKGGFLCKGKRIGVEYFEPTGAGKHPAVVLVHGLDGPQDKHYRTVARQLAKRGYVVALVHYLDRTGTRKEALPELIRQFRALLDKSDAPVKMPPALRATFRAWRETVSASVAHVRKHPRVDADRVGLVGFSMGGFLATSVAAQPELRIACVAELFGGLPSEVASTLEHMPPTLIIHGGRDRTVPVQQADAFRKVLEARKLSFQVKIYKSAGHGFVTDKGAFDWLAALDATIVTWSFLDRHLRTNALGRHVP